MVIVRVSFARLDGGLPNDLAGSANDMAIWLAARSIRAPSASYRCPVPANPSYCQRVRAICGFLPSKLSHAHHPPRLPNPGRLRDENCPGRHLTWGPATRLHHLTGGDPAPCLVAGEGDQR